MAINNMNIDLNCITLQIGQKGTELDTKQMFMKIVSLL